MITSDVRCLASALVVGYHRLDAAMYTESAVTLFADQRLEVVDVAACTDSNPRCLAAGQESYVAFPSYRAPDLTTVQSALFTKFRPRRLT